MFAPPVYSQDSNHCKCLNFKSWHVSPLLRTPNGSSKAFLCTRPYVIWLPAISDFASHRSPPTPPALTSSFVITLVSEAQSPRNSHESLPHFHMSPLKWHFIGETLPDQTIKLLPLKHSPPTYSSIYTTYSTFFMETFFFINKCKCTYTFVYCVYIHVCICKYACIRYTYTFYMWIHIHTFVGVRKLQPRTKYSPSLFLNNHKLRTVFILLKDCERKN